MNVLGKPGHSVLQSYAMLAAVKNTICVHKVLRHTRCNWLFV